MYGLIMGNTVMGEINTSIDLGFAIRDGKVVGRVKGRAIGSNIYDLLLHCRSLRLPRVMATCGYLINEKSIKKLKRTGIKALSFSLDGISPRTHDTIRQADGAFEATVKAAKIARDAGVRFQINTTISKLNIDEFVGIADLALKLGATCFNPFILVPTGRGSRIPDAIIDPIEYESLLNELLIMKMKSKIMQLKF